MKTFDDLKFRKVLSFGGVDNTLARLDFPNGYGVSVVCGDRSYSSDGTYELAVLRDGKICYDTFLTNDVLGWQTPEQVTEHMEALQKIS